MSKYAYVNNDKVVEELYDFLPSSWRNVSGLNNASDEDLKSVGFYKIVKDNMAWDPTQYTLDSISYTYDEERDEVVEALNFSAYNVKYTEQDLSLKKEWVMNEIRAMRDQLLRESDWTQTVDVVSSSTEEWNAAWRDYRKALRDMPEIYGSQELWTIAQVTWPSKPSP